MSHSAEFLRGAVESHRNTCNLITSITSAEKSHPARQGLMAANYELHNQLDRYRALLAKAEAREADSTTLEPDVHRSYSLGDAPDAAAVIAQCKAALVAIRNEVSAGCHPDAPVEELKDGIHFEPVLEVDSVLAAIAKWEAGR